MKILNTENIRVEVRFGNLGRGKKDRTSDSVILDIEMGMKKISRLRGYLVILKGVEKTNDFTFLDIKNNCSTRIKGKYCC